jgi:cell division protein FtsI (penicillin-binding protein 3)
LPASDPQIIIYVVVDSPTGEVLYGNTVAAPIFREVALQVARIMNIPPDKENLKNKIGKSNRKR